MIVPSAVRPGRNGCPGPRRDVAGRKPRLESCNPEQPDNSFVRCIPKRKSPLPDYFRQGRFHENRTRRTFLRFPEEISGEEQVSGADPKFPEKVAVLLRECPAQNFRKEQALRSGPKFPESDRPPAGMAPVCGADSCRTAAGRLDVGTDALRGKPPADLFTAAARVRAILRFGVPAAIPGCNAPSRRRRGRLLPPA